MEQTPVGELPALFPPPQSSPPRDAHATMQQNFLNHTKRYQNALQNAAASVDPHLRPAEAFFAPPQTQPRITTCTICAAHFVTHEQLVQHVEMMHPGIFTPANTPPAYAVPPPLNPLTHLQTTASNIWFSTPSTTAPEPAPSVLPSQEQFSCAICEIICLNEDQLTSHLGGQKHRKKAELHALFQEAAKTFPQEGITRLGKRLWSCILCHHSIDSDNSLLQHLTSTKHKRSRETATKKKRFPKNTNATQKQTPSLPPSGALTALREAQASLATVAANAASPVPHSSTPPPPSPAPIASIVSQPILHMPIPGITPLSQATPMTLSTPMALSTPMSLSTPVAQPIPSARTQAPLPPFSSIWSASMPVESSLPPLSNPMVDSPIAKPVSPFLAKPVGPLPQVPMPQVSVPQVSPRQVPPPQISSPQVPQPQVPQPQVSQPLVTPPQALPSTQPSSKPLQSGIAKAPRAQAVSNKSASVPSYTCSICSVTCNSMDSLNAHLASVRHRRKQNQLEGTGGGAPPDQNYRCGVCSVTCCGKMNYDAHLKGKLHAKRLRLNSASRTQNSVPKINAGMECAPGSVQTAVEEAQTPELVCALNIVDLTPEDIAQANSSPPIKTPIPKGQPKSSGESNSHAGPREQS